MLPVTGNVNAQPRKISCKLEIGGNTITNVKMLTYSSDWSGNVTVGQVVSSYISVTLPTPSNLSLAGANVTLSMGIGDPVEWVKIGIFRIDEESIRTKQGYTSFNAYDKLYNSVNTYHSTGDKSLQAICNEVCSAIGITSTTLSASITIDSSMLDGYTLRDVLGFIAGYQGKNAYLSPPTVSAPNGALDLRWFASSGYTADGTRANIPFIGESDCTIGRWICQTQDGVIDAGSGEGIYFTCPFMTTARLSSLQQGQSLTYRKADVDIPYGNFCLQSGDIITVTTVQNQTLTVPVMNNSWTYDGGLSSAVTSYGVSDYQGTANNAERSVSARRFQSILAEHKAANRVKSEIKQATDLITGTTGGHIRINFDGTTKEPAEILIMDTDDIGTAQNVWVFNQSGLGHFPHGYGVGNVNLALLMTGTIVAERIAGTMISGVGIENIDRSLTTRPKIALANGCIHFTETYSYDGQTEQVTDIGKIEYLARSGQNNPATLALTCLNGNNISIGEYGYPKFVYHSDPTGTDKMFHFYGDVRFYDDAEINNLAITVDDGQGGTKTSKSLIEILNDFDRRISALE